MPNSGKATFVDYYDVLQVNPQCDAKMLESAYHYLAKLYHPDHSGTVDTTMFNEVTEAYRLLRDPERRAEYDILHAQYRPQADTRYPTSAQFDVDEQAALDDADDHARILTYLYTKRREDAQNPGVVGFYLQEALQCSDEIFEFHKWYLKEKGYIVTTEQGMLAITIKGVDHVIEMSRAAKDEKLLIEKEALRRRS
ncbi:J domain-containing protein [Sphingomonas jaspsi]|uniref:J domain-containing protein n=1 Tax=Sphingomonas jaspsi TaxID=392409 RepID=UPI0004B3C05E|nr:J domain-containing protein [Sphingomonas jaspsi]